MDSGFKLRIFTCLSLLIAFISSDCLAQSNLVKMPSVKACDHIVSYANKGELQKILIKPKKVDFNKISIPRNLSGVDNIFEIDINNDGVLERVFVQDLGTAHFESFSVYSVNYDTYYYCSEVLLSPFFGSCGRTFYRTFSYAC